MWNRITQQEIASFEDFIGTYKLCKSRGTEEERLEGNRQAYAALRAAELGDELCFKLAWGELKKFSRKNRPQTDRMFYDCVSSTNQTISDLLTCNLTGQAASLAEKWIEEATEPIQVNQKQGSKTQEVFALYQRFTELRERFGAKLNVGDLFVKSCVERDQSPEFQQVADLYRQFTKLWINEDIFSNPSAPRHQDAESRTTVALFQNFADLNKQFNALWMDSDPLDTVRGESHQGSKFQQFSALHKQFADWRTRHHEIWLDNLERSLKTLSMTQDVAAVKNVNAVPWL